MRTTLRTILHKTVEHKPALDDEHSCTVGNVRPRSAELGKILQLPAPVLDPIKNAVGHCRILRRDVAPDFEQIFAGAAREADLAHTSDF